MQKLESQFNFNKENSWGFEGCRESSSWLFLDEPSLQGIFDLLGEVKDFRQILLHLSAKNNIRQIYCANIYSALVTLTIAL